MRDEPARSTDVFVEHDSPGVSRMPTPRSIVLALALLTACTTEDQGQQEGFQRYDSAGVSITVNSRTLVEDAPELSPVEDLRLGAVSGNPAEEFGLLRDLAVDTAGTIYAVDMRAGTIRVFDREGRPLRTLGQPGQGPGEFDFSILRFAVGNDTVLALDRYRLHAFDTAGTHLHTTRQEVAGNEIIPVLEHSAAGWMAGRSVTTPATDPSRRLTRDTFRVWPVDVANGEVLDPVVEMPGRPRVYWEDLDRSDTQWLSPEPTAAVRPNGEIYVTDGTGYEIHVVSPSSELLRSIRADAVPVRISDAEFEEGVRKVVEYYDSAGLPPAWGRRFAEAAEAGGRPEIRPVPGRLFVAPNGRMLLQRRDLDPDPSPYATQDSSTWDLLRPSGRIDGRLQLPAHTLVSELTDDYLYVIERDELDVQYVVRYRLQVQEEAAGDGGM